MAKTKTPKIAKEDIETCSNCRFFLMDDPKDDAGYCRRYPPQYVGSEEEGGFTYAVITPADWCGEHKRVTQ